ncbi:hypothetical protein Hanom_Chr07g00673301 [Helianthus anomalus]
MDHKKHQSGGSSSSSSFTENLFGPKDTSSASSSGLFSTVFDYKTQRSAGPVYQNETAEPSYLSSSIYYGGQEDYAPNTETTRPPHTSKKDGGDNDPNGSSASRGNWWQGSLYY